MCEQGLINGPLSRMAFDGVGVVAEGRILAWANPRGGADRALLARARRASRFTIAATRRAGVSALSGDDPFRGDAD